MATDAKSSGEQNYVFAENYLYAYYKTAFPVWVTENLRSRNENLAGSSDPYSETAWDQRIKDAVANMQRISEWPL